MQFVTVSKAGSERLSALSLRLKEGSFLPYPIMQLIHIMLMFHTMLLLYTMSVFHMFQRPISFHFLYYFPCILFYI